MTSKEAAELLGVSRDLFRRLVNDHGLPFTQIGCRRKFRPEELRRYVVGRSAVLNDDGPPASGPHVQSSPGVDPPDNGQA